METNKNVIAAQEKHVAAINSAIDALINLEDFTPLPNALCLALSKLNSMRNYAESDIESGDKVYDTFNKKYQTIKEVGVLNYFFENGASVGIKFCFPVAN